MAALRAAALPHLRRLAALLDETASLTVRTPVRRARRRYAGAAGLLPLAEPDSSEMDDIHTEERYREHPNERPAPLALRAELARIRRSDFVVGKERSERGLLAVGAPVRDADGTAVAGPAVSMPSVRYDRHGLGSRRHAQIGRPRTRVRPPLLCEERHSDVSPRNYIACYICCSECVGDRSSSSVRSWDWRRACCSSPSPRRDG
ncbi:IclR family transcriptional regulator domain-containing protein [Prauserella shujinwangii]|uniref:IclR family transcriptional regulator domain-containing protein n=1 Tax=Prauserella shujinwangii TaxID=1453103 RepID=UPI003CCBC098